MNKVTLDEYLQFIKDFDNGVYPNQRMGQAFMNKFDVKLDTQLFYMQKRKETLILICDKYVKQD